MLSVVNDEPARVDGQSMLDEICREGARTMLAAALEAEVDAYLAELAGERDENGHALRRRSTTAAVGGLWGRSVPRTSPAPPATRRWTETRTRRRTSAIGRTMPILAQLEPAPCSTPGHHRLVRMVVQTAGRMLG
jgi:hypothetical protein